MLSFALIVSKNYNPHIPEQHLTKGKNQKKIVVTLPVQFEYTVIPILWLKRGLKYYILYGEAVTCAPFSTVPKLVQATLAMDLVYEVAVNEQWKEVSKAAKSTDKKQLMMWLVTVGIIAIVGILASGDYFK